MIKVSNLTKKFGQFTAVDNLSFDVSTGEVVALWGPNGAGKTTIIRALLGLLKTRGELRINGLNVKKEGKKARAIIGYVPQELAFYDDLSVWDTLSFYATLKSVPAARIYLVLEEVGLTEHSHKNVASLSGGMKQRLALASALLTSPPLLILDEPTSNLDSAARDDFIMLLAQQKEQGKTVLFTSHRLEEIESLATRVLVLKDGKLKLTCHNPAELATELGMILTLKLVIAEEIRDTAINLLQAQGLIVSRNGRCIQVNIVPSAKIVPLKILLDENIEIKNFEIDNGYLKYRT